MKKFIPLLMMLISSCSTSTSTSTQSRRYGDECFGKPYTVSRDTQALCMTAAIAKYNKQVQIVND